MTTLENTLTSSWSVYTGSLDININQTYSIRTLTGTYIEVWYQDNDWTYYINKQSITDLFILFFFIALVLFTLFSLTIKTFNKWKK